MREYILRRFNIDYLNMEEVGGSDVQKIIGMGTRRDPKSGETHPVTSFYHTFHSHVVDAFVLYPITKHFGITVEDAMNMPVNEWYHLRQVAKKLAEVAPPDLETSMFQLVKELATLRLGGGSE